MHPAAKVFWYKPLANLDVLEKIFSTAGATGQHSQSFDTLLKSVKAEMSNSDIELVGNKVVYKYDGDKEEKSDKEVIDKGMEKQKDKNEEKRGRKKRRDKVKEVLREKRKRTSSANIIIASLEHIEEGASTRMRTLLKVKMTRTTESTLSRAVKLLGSEHYISWTLSNLEKTLDLVEDEERAEVYVSLEGYLCDAWLKRNKASL